MTTTSDLTLIAQLHTALTTQATELHPCFLDVCGGHIPIGWIGGRGPTDKDWPCVVADDGGRTAVPDYITYAGMGIVLDTLAAKGYGVDISTPGAYAEVYQWGESGGWLLRARVEGERDDDDPPFFAPEAVARATLEALSGGMKGEWA